MPARNRRWITNLFGKRTPRPAAGRPARVKTRFLRVEWLEPRRLLSGGTLADLLVQMTPDPHPSGDLPADLSQVVPLSTFTAGPTPPDVPTDPDVHAFVVGLEQVYADIEDNSAARPAVWGANVPASPHQFSLHLDDNGMLIGSWIVDWGDGSDPQTVSPQPWVIHQYPAAGDYTISVKANSPDGTYSASSTSWVDTVGIGGGGGTGLGAYEYALPPTLHVAGQQTVALGQTFALDGLANFSYPDESEDSEGVSTDFTYTIDWGDGSPEFDGANVDVIAQAGTGTPFLGALASDAGDGPLTHVYTAAGDYDLAVTVTSTVSGLSDTQIIPIDVVELTPSIAASYTSGDEGTADTFTASDTADASLSDPVAYQWQVLDSSGDLLDQGTDPTLDYTFTAPDTYTVSLTATVDNVTSAPAIQTVTVDNLAPSFVGTIPSVTLNVGQTYNLSAAFSDINPNDTHTATVDWGDGSSVDTGATVTEESSDGTTPGTVTDSYAYSASGSYTGTITVIDSEGLSTSQTFSVTVDAPTVTLTGFKPDASDDTKLEVGYTVTGSTAAPFNIEIYTSTDGVTPDQLLMPYTVDGIDSPLTSGSQTAIFPASFDDVPGDYHLIAVSDACTNTVEFAGGVFSATSVTASPAQTTLYVFGGAGGDTADIYGPADSPSNTVAFDNGTVTDYDIGSATAIHVVGENGALTATADKNVTLPIAMDGGSGNDTFTGGGGNDTIVGGTGTNVIHSSDGVDNPQIVDDTDAPTLDEPVNNFLTDGTWNPQTVAGAFNGEEKVSSGTATAVWTFDDLDTSAYYDLYVTWTPIAGASIAAQYSVYDDTSPSATEIYPLGQSSIATVDQTQAPGDFQAAGEYWHDLGVFQVTSGTLIVHLVDGGGTVLADAAMIVPDATIPLTNLTMDNFDVDDNGNLSVSYTINGEDSPPFSIGIYQSADGVQPGALAGTIDVSDPDDLTGGGTEHTLTYQDSLNGLSGGAYYLAQLDAYDEVPETIKSDNTSAPLTGVYEDASGSLYVLAANDDSGHSIAISEDSSTGNVSVTLDSGSPQTFEHVGEVYVAAYHGANTIDAAGIDLPLYVYGGTGSDTITGGDGGNTIYGGAAGGNVIYAGAGADTIYGHGTLSNTIYGGAGTDTIYAGNGGDTIIGGTGNAEIYGGTGNDIIYGGSGNNWIQAGSGNATITGGPGNDWLIAGSGTDLIQGGSGTEVIEGGSGTDTLIGGSGMDTITGGSGTNFIYGNGVHDILQGGSGSNFIQPNANGGSGLASIEVENSSGSPTFDGNIDADGNSDSGDYRAIADPGYGGMVADWEFNNFESDARLGDVTSTPVAVYANWQPTGSPSPGTQWSAGAVYKVIDVTAGGAVLGTFTVNQNSSPGSASPEGADRPWDLLGVFNVTVGDTIEVELLSADAGPASVGDALCAGDVMIHAIWPTVSIRPTGVTVNPLVATVNDGYYADWVDANQSIDIPVEGDGSRAEVQLSASIEPLYFDMSGSSTNDWHALLPSVTGLEFWTAAQGGTQLTPDGNDNLIDQQLSGSTGVYNGTVWVSQAPGSGSSSATATLSSIGFRAAFDGSSGVAANLRATPQPTFVVVLNEGSQQSKLGPAGSILTPADVQWISEQRTEFLATLGSISNPAMPPGNAGSVFETCLSMAQNDLPLINTAIAGLAAMEADPTVSDTTYRQAYLNALELYDAYAITLVQVEIAKANYIKSLWFPLSTSDSLLQQFDQLPTEIPGFFQRGMYLTAAEHTAILNGGNSIARAIDANRDYTDFLGGAITSIAIGAGIVATVATGGTYFPVFMAYAGGTLLAAGSVASMYSRITNDHLSGSSLVSSTLKDVSGFTALNIGLFNIDPVNHKAQHLSGSERGWQFGAGFTAIVTLGIGAAKSVTTLELTWSSIANFKPPSGLQTAGGSALAALWPLVVPAATADIAVAVTQLGGAQIVLMAARPGNGSTVPQYARNVLATIRATGKAPAGYMGGSPFQNDGRGGGQVLPKTDANGNPITYREWDVHPYTPGVNRGPERIVTGSDGSAYYTSDHYMTFVPM